MPPQHTRDWIDVLEALGPFTTVIAVLIIGFVQAFLQRKQLAYNLFDKRYAIYSELGAFFLSAVANDVQFDNAAVDRFRISTAHAEFLFGQDVITFLAEVVSKAIQLALVNSKIYRLIAQVATPADSAELLALREARARLVNWMFEAHERQNTVFHGYLELDTDLPWYARLEQYMEDLLERLDRMMNRNRLESGG
jgi:hypothetical protein